MPFPNTHAPYARVPHTDASHMDASVAARSADTSGGEHAEKRRRVLALLDAASANAVALTSQAALAWYLQGARTHVSLAGGPIVAAVVDRDGEAVHVTSNEEHRLVAEELPSWAQPVVVAHPWHRDVVATAEAQALAAGGLREEALAAGLRNARQSLHAEEAARYRILGRDVARLLTRELAAARPDEAEADLAARLTAGVVDLGAEPLVVLVGGDSRAAHRHPLPTRAPLGRRAMAVVCARRHGLILNITRWVRFGPRTADERTADARILGVEAVYLSGSRPGGSLQRAFDAGTAAYLANGFASDEWTRHHQGGVAGYAGRDPRALPGLDLGLGTDVAFAWNPTAAGCKVEDTILSTQGGFEVLSVDPEWPTVASVVPASHDGAWAPQVLDRPDVLEL
ncbi:peptidase M24 [Sinomonas sp. ASV486]|uniref:M24 family metallopeptidase n=1 Tax=Sinomonas sp. ASV486 TaxID=3051170 RepID=UPI0027DDB8D4|nr:peptidase M24 [Sinomonas sp. ASV486]MDQ4492055.1 peptidase M24 [Sinomonas sp. ASV486]